MRTIAQWVKSPKFKVQIGRGKPFFPDAINEVRVDHECDNVDVNGDGVFEHANPVTSYTIDMVRDGKQERLRFKNARQAKFKNFTRVTFWNPIEG